MNQRDISHTLEISKWLETSTKRIREEWTYVAETTTEIKFKIIYNKRPKLSLVGKEKVTIDIDDIGAPETNIDTSTIIMNESDPNTPDEEQVNNEGT